MDDSMLVVIESDVSFYSFGMFCMGLSQQI
jgi:hypothetical protein